jgi:hypothetical protein
MNPGLTFKAGFQIGVQVRTLGRTRTNGNGHDLRLRVACKPSQEDLSFQGPLGHADPGQGVEEASRGE